MTASILTSLICGILLTVQVAANRQLGTALHSPLAAASISFLVGLVALVGLTLILRQAPPLSHGVQAPWWAWMGGLMGAVYVASTIILMPRLGAAALMSLVIGGQLMAALALDHYGWLGVSRHAFNLPRLAGAGMLVAGVTLMLRF